MSKLSTESIGSPLFDCVCTANVNEKIIWFVQVVCNVKTMMQMLHTQK